MRMAILMYWETAVEIPAPRTPSLRTKIRNISPKMFKIPPEARPSIAKKAFPSYRRMLFITQLDAMAGAAIRIQVLYSIA